MKLRFFTAAIVTLASWHTAAPPSRADDELYRRVALSTAAVYRTEGPMGGSSGTGFLIDAKERLLVTARHVIANPSGGVAGAVIVVFAEQKDGEVVTEASHYRRSWQRVALRGKVLYDSVRRDLAIVQVNRLPDGIRPLELASKPARPGQTVHIVGNSNEHMGALFSYCEGKVRNNFRWDNFGSRILLTHVPTNKGDSGGPTVNHLGEVVGFAAMSTTGTSSTRISPFTDLQVTGVSVCVSEIRAGLDEMRNRQLATQSPGGEKAALLKGTSRPGIHRVWMDKDAMYRIVVKASGFVPDVSVDNIVLSPLAPPVGTVVQHLYRPTQSKEFQIHVSHFPGLNFGKGPFTYAIDVELATFEPEGTPEKRQAKLNEHKQRFEAGKLYIVTVVAKGFEPDVQVVDGTKVLTTRYNNGITSQQNGAQNFLSSVGLARAEYETSFSFVPTRTADYRLLVQVSPFSPPHAEPLDYQVRVSEQKFDLNVSDKLTAKDPLYPQAGPFKAYTVKMEAGREYQCDLVTTAFDSALRLEDSAGKTVAFGLDVDAMNSRLLFLPPRSDTYRLIVTSHRIDATGEYTLTLSSRKK